MGLLPADLCGARDRLLKPRRSPEKHPIEATDVVSYLDKGKQEPN